MASRLKNARQLQDAVENLDQRFTRQVIYDRKSKEMDFMNFEVEMRKAMMQLVDPMLAQSIKDREDIEKLKSKDQSLEDRINLLEVTLYKTKSKNKETMFDVIQKNIVDLRVGTQKFYTDVNNEIQEFYKDITNKNFILSQKVTEIETYKEQITTNKNTI